MAADVLWLVKPANRQIYGCSTNTGQEINMHIYPAVETEDAHTE